MIHLVIRNGIVVNRVNGARPEGLPPTSSSWIAAEGELADVQIGWIEQPDGTFAAPVIVEPPAEPEA